MSGSKAQVHKSVADGSTDGGDGDGTVLSNLSASHIKWGALVAGVLGVAYIVSQHLGSGDSGDTSDETDDEDNKPSGGIDRIQNLDSELTRDGDGDEDLDEEGFEAAQETAVNAIKEAN